MAPDHPRQPRPGSYLALWLLLTIIWFAANSSLAPKSIATGALISAGLTVVFMRSFPAWADVRPSPVRLLHFLRYTGVFVVELVRANLNMLRYVYAPRIDINPGIVKIKTRLKSPRRAPGARELDRADARIAGASISRATRVRPLARCQDHRYGRSDRVIAGPFEEHLEKIFG